jgi:hypothetical protein
VFTLYVKFLGRVRLNLTLQRALHRSARFHINQTVSGELSIFQFHISVGKSIALSSPNAHKALKGLQSFFLRFFRRPPPRNDVLLRKKRSGLKVKVQSSTQQSLLPLVDGRSGGGGVLETIFFPSPPETGEIGRSTNCKNVEDRKRHRPVWRCAHTPPCAVIITPERSNMLPSGIERNIPSTPSFRAHKSMNET